MIKLFIAFVVAPALHAPSLAALPFNADTICRVSGSGGCADAPEGKVCVGGGIRDNSVRLMIEDKGRRLKLNNIVGWIRSAETEPRID